MPSDLTRPGGLRYTPVQRRLLTAVGGLLVAALAGGAYALTYDVLRELAIAGGVGDRWAPLYPVMADTLTALTILSLVITRNARWWTRLLRWTLLLALVAGGAALSVQYSVWGYSGLSQDALRAGVAIAPHVMLVIAVWLWLTMFKQIRVARPVVAETGPAETQRGHVKVLEPATPEPEAGPEPDPEPGSPLAFLDDPEPEPLIPFLPDPPELPVPEPVAHVPVPREPTHESPDQEFPAPGPAAPDAVAPEAVGADPAASRPVAAGPAVSDLAVPERKWDESAEHGRPVLEQSLSSEPAPPLDALPEPPAGPPALLPTDVELVKGGRSRAGADKRPPSSATRPDIVVPALNGADDEDHDTPPTDRPEDADGGDHADAPVHPPPSSSFRSGPTPPAD